MNGARRISIRLLIGLLALLPTAALAFTLLRADRQMAQELNIVSQTTSLVQDQVADYLASAVVVSDRYARRLMLQAAREGSTIMTSSPQLSASPMGPMIPGYSSSFSE